MRETMCCNAWHKGCNECDLSSVSLDRILFPSFPPRQGERPYDVARAFSEAYGLDAEQMEVVLDVLLTKSPERADGAGEVSQTAPDASSREGTFKPVLFQAGKLGMRLMRNDDGALVDTVFKNSQAEHGGVAPGFYLYSVNGRVTPTYEEALTALEEEPRPAQILFRMPAGKDPREKKAGSETVPSNVNPPLQDSPGENLLEETSNENLLQGTLASSQAAPSVAARQQMLVERERKKRKQQQLDALLLQEQVLEQEGHVLEPKLFRPTYEYQPVKDYQEVPPGLQIRMSVGEEGGKMARIPDPWQLSIWVESVQKFVRVKVRKVLHPFVLPPPTPTHSPLFARPRVLPSSIVYFYFRCKQCVPRGVGRGVETPVTVSKTTEGW
jgi:hypothetical protein